MHTFRVRVVSQASSLQEGVIEARGGGRGKGGSLDTGGGEVERLRRREGGEGKEEKKERRRRSKEERKKSEEGKRSELRCRRPKLSSRCRAPSPEMEEK